MKKLVYLLMLNVICWHGVARADDIDIYVGNKVGNIPLLMLMLDWRPSVFATFCNKWDADCKASMSDGAAAALEDARLAAGTSFDDKVSRYEVFVAILESVMNTSSITDPTGGSAFDDIYIGLMISNFDEGGAILEGYKRIGDPLGDYFTDDEITGFGLDPATAEIKDYLIYRLRQITEPANNSASHKLQPSEAFYEMYSYWNGGAVGYSNTAGTANNFQTIIPPDPAFDATIMDDSETTYTAPSEFSDSSCTAVYAIMMAMNVANDDDDLDAKIENAMDATAAVKFEDMLTYMKAHDMVPTADGTQDLTTWVISDSGSRGSTVNWADAGGSGAGLLDFEDAVELEAKLVEAFTKIISESSTFVAASVPVNVFSRTLALPDVYIALFEARSTIHWPGNLKKLNLKDTDGDGIFDDIVDVNDVPAIETSGDDKGRIKLGALTFWTDAGNLPDPNPEKGEVAGADGRSVERGGAGQIIPGFLSGTIAGSNGVGTRQLYTEPLTNYSTPATLIAFNADNSTANFDMQSYLGASSQAEAKTLIAWARGQDTDNNSTAPRSWILDAAIHSRPLALNYGSPGSYSDTNQHIHLLMGSNDGFFHAFENTSSDGSQSGKELWGFMPRELLKNIKEYKSDSQSSSKMLYGIDGQPVVLRKDSNNDGTLDYSAGDEAIVYFGLRRGGYSYYALDVSNPDAVPTLKWSITNSGDFDKLALTFSAPVVTKVKYGTTATDVVIFAGGYNGGWDDASNRVGKDLNDDDDTVGNAIYIVDARTGALIWKAEQGASTGAVSNTEYNHTDMVDSIPSEITPVDANRNGITDRLYVGDTGGAVWRVDLTEGSDSNQRLNSWFITKFAELGTDGTTTDRRFFHRPEVVLTKDGIGNYDGVLIESGDRAHPLDKDVVNYLFLLKDRIISNDKTAVMDRETNPGPYEVDDLPDVTTCITGEEVACVTDPANGWRIELKETGEKGMSTPIVDAGRAFFTTYVPTITDEPCDVDEGHGALYVTNLSNGAPVNGDQRKYDLGPGIPPEVENVAGGEGKDVLIIPGGGAEGDFDGDGTIDSGPVTPSLAKGLYLLYWRELGIDDL